MSGFAWGFAQRVAGGFARGCSQGPTRGLARSLTQGDVHGFTRGYARVPRPLLRRALFPRRRLLVPSTRPGLSTLRDHVPTPVAPGRKPARLSLR